MTAAARALEVRLGTDDLLTYAEGLGALPGRAAAAPRTRLACRADAPEARAGGCATIALTADERALPRRIDQRAVAAAFGSAWRTGGAGATAPRRVA